jgi:hypothetical protein
MSGKLTSHVSLFCSNSSIKSFTLCKNYFCLGSKIVAMGEQKNLRLQFYQPTFCVTEWLAFALQHTNSYIIERVSVYSSLNFSVFLKLHKNLKEFR